MRVEIESKTESALKHTLQQIVKDDPSLGTIDDEPYLAIGPAYIKTASICGDLLPKLSEFNSFADITIIGNKPLALSDYYPRATDFTKRLKQWAKQGATIHYLYTSPQAFSELECGTLQRITDIYYSSPSNKVNYYTLNPEAQEEFQRFEEYHFIIFSKPNLMWIESKHPPGIMKAHNCRYFNQEDTAEYYEFYNVHKEIAQRIMSNSTKVHL